LSADAVWQRLRHSLRRNWVSLLQRGLAIRRANRSSRVLHNRGPDNAAYASEL
jgi:hypothetical protein